MGVRHYRELRAWQHAIELKRLVISITAKPAVKRDFEFCDQISDSSRSIAAHIAEGFARFSPREFLQYLRFASGSVAETETWLLDGLDRGYLTPAEHEHAADVAGQCAATITALARSIRRRHSGGQ